MPHRAAKNSPLRKCMRTPILLPYGQPRRQHRQYQYQQQYQYLQCRTRFNIQHASLSSNFKIPVLPSANCFSSPEEGYPPITGPGVGGGPCMGIDMCIGSWNHEMSQCFTYVTYHQSGESHFKNLEPLFKRESYALIILLNMKGLYFAILLFTSYWTK